jgi:pyridoxine 4-dehydrogenase
MRLSAAAAFGESPVRSREQAITVLREAVRAGVNHLDTAAFYFSGLQSANTLIAAALTPYPADLVIATKVGPARGRSGEWLPTATPEQLRGQVEENLRQLGRDHLDLVYLRRAADMDSVGAHVAALAQLRAAGLIRHLGLSGVSLADLREAQEIAPVVSVQNRYGVEARDEAANELLATCGAEGIAFVPFFTIAGAGRHRGGQRCWPWPQLTARAPRRSGWRGRSASARTCWRYRGPGTRSTCVRTWQPRPCA